MNFTSPLLVSQGVTEDEVNLELYKPYFMWRDTEFDARRLQVVGDDADLYDKYVISVPRLFPSKAEQETIETIAQA